MSQDVIVKANVVNGAHNKYQWVNVGSPLDINIEKGNIKFSIDS